jgi:hypothetical protein
MGGYFLQGETAFMSPPWGGPDYAKVDVYDMKSMLIPCDGLVPCFYFKRVISFSLHSLMFTYFVSKTHQRSINL